MKSLVKKVLLTVFVSLITALFLCLLFSPRLTYLIFVRSTASDSVTLQATTHDCALARRGTAHVDGIRCTLNYSFNGALVSAQAWAWESSDALTSLDALHRRLAALDQGAQIEIDVDQDDPAQPHVVPQSWFVLSTSALGLALYAGLLVAIVALSTKILGVKKVEHRADFDYDAQGKLVRVRPESGNKKTPLMFFALRLLGCALLIATFYALTNWPANHALFLERAGMAQMPAILTHCAWRHRGGSKGHDQNECDFSYIWQGEKMTGQAEALDFFLFPTEARLDAATDAAEGRHVTAYVDPAQPGYAIAFIDDDLFVPQTISLGVLFWFVLGAFYAGLAWRSDGQWSGKWWGK